MCVPSNSLTTKTRLEIIANHDSAFCGNCIFNPFAERIYIPINGVAPNGDCISGGVTFINGKVWFENSDFLQAPSVICRGRSSRGALECSGKIGVLSDMLRQQVDEVRQISICKVWIRVRHSESVIGS